MGFVLGKDEVQVDEKQFTANLLLAWLKTDFTITSKRIVGEQPNTLLGLIPFGKKEVTYPLKNIASVSVSTKFHAKRFVLGLFLGFLGIATLDGVGFIFLLLAVLPLLNCFTSSLDIRNNSGQATNLELSILEKDKVKDFVKQVNTCIADVA
jgi:uncharacterized membrane protein YidH (DUF202 family)